VRLKIKTSHLYLQMIRLSKIELSLSIIFPFTAPVLTYFLYPSNFLGASPTKEIKSVNKKSFTINLS